MEKEIWKDILGYEGLYQVSNYGKIKSLERTYDQKTRCGNISIWHKKERILKPCIIKNNGYLAVWLRKNGQSKAFTVHRIVAKHFIPNTNFYPEVNHKDGNKENNQASNLEWVTRNENIRHSYRNSKRKTMGFLLSALN